MIMRIRNLMVAASVICLSACVIGQNAAEWPFAKGPNGATVKLVGPTQTLTGELLEVRDEGVVVAGGDGKIVFAPFTTLRLLEVAEPAAAYVNSNDPHPAEDVRSRLKVVSHFPQGMTADVRARMLARTGQSEPMVLQ
jgi:hypothetical protein